MADIPRGVRLAIPAGLSLLRLVLAVVFVLGPTSIRPAVVVGAGLSDWLDGLVARRLGSTTWWGAVLDAVADKAFTIVVLVVLVLDGWLAIWQVALLLARDVVILAGLVWLALRGQRHDVIRLHVRWSGKIATLLIFLFLALLVTWPHSFWLDWVVFVVAAVASVAAAIDYGLSVARFSLRGGGAPAG